MALQYALYPNPLTDNPDEYRAVIQNRRSRDREDIVDMMIQAGSTVSKSDALAVLEEYDKARLRLLSRGEAVVTPMVHIFPSIKGKFDGYKDRFHPSRHEVLFNAHPGERTGRITSDIKVRKVAAKGRFPVLKSFTDVTSDTENKMLTAGGGGIISGRRLKTDPQDPEQGVFLITTRSGKRKEIRMPKLIRNKPSEVIFMLPEELESGKYTLEVRAMVRRTSVIRTGRLDTLLVVS